MAKPKPAPGVHCANLWPDNDFGGCHNQAPTVSKRTATMSSISDFWNPAFLSCPFVGIRRHHLPPSHSQPMRTSLMMRTLRIVCSSVQLERKRDRVGTWLQTCFPSRVWLADTTHNHLNLMSGFGDQQACCTQRKRWAHSVYTSRRTVSLD